MPPYRYRTLTDEQKANVVRERLDRGHPRHEPPHPEQGPGWYFVTARLLRAPPAVPNAGVS